MQPFHERYPKLPGYVAVIVFVLTLAYLLVTAKH